MRQIALELRDRGIPSPSGKPQWGTSTLDRLLRNEAYIGTVYYNRNERIQGDTRGRMTRQRERPREEWIAIPVSAIIDRDTFDRVNHITHENWLSPRGAAPDAYLLRGLIQCGHCHVSCNCHTSNRKKGTRTRYYSCRNHDVLRARSEDRLCPERSIRSDALDEYVFGHVRQALLDPQQLLAGERAVLSGAPDENELVAGQLKRLNTAIDAKRGERARLLDAYQAGLFELDELTRRTGALTARRDQLARETELANWLRQSLPGSGRRPLEAAAVRQRDRQRTARRDTRCRPPRAEPAYTVRSRSMTRRASGGSTSTRSCRPASLASPAPPRHAPRRTSFASR